MYLMEEHRLTPVIRCARQQNWEVAGSLALREICLCHFDCKCNLVPTLAGRQTSDSRETL